MKRWRTQILGSLIDAVTKEEAVSILDYFLTAGQHHVVTPNPEFVLEARKNHAFRQIINQADLAIPDGFGLVIASRFTKIKIERHVSGSDLVGYLLEQAGRKGLGVAVINYSDSLSSAGEIEKMLPRRFPGLRIKAFEIEHQAGESFSLLGSLRSFQPAILLTALGSPSQDIWINQHLKLLPSVRLAMGIGGSLDFLTGKRRRGPRWMRRSGLEWLYRMFNRPSGGKYYFGRRLKKIFRSVVVFPLVFVFTANKNNL